MSPRWNWDSPTPLAASEYALPPGPKGGGHTRLRLKGGGVPIPTTGETLSTLPTLCLTACALAHGYAILLISIQLKLKTKEIYSKYLYLHCIFKFRCNYRIGTCMSTSFFTFYKLFEIGLNEFESEE
jgi:hypothetical protein